MMGDKIGDMELASQGTAPDSLTRSQFSTSERQEAFPGANGLRRYLESCDS